MSNQKIEPLYDNVVIQPEKEESKTNAGIFIPETATKEKKQIGKVVAVGPGKFNDHGDRMPMHVQIADRVIYAQYSGDDIKINGEEYKVVSEERILGILK